MSVRKISNNKFKIIIECGYDIFGKRTRHCEIFKGTSAEAKIREAELMKEHYHKGNKVNINNLDFEEYSNLFLEKYCCNNVSNITIRNYKQMLKRINQYIGKFKLCKITSVLLDSLYQKLRVGEKGNILSGKTMTHYYNLIGLMLNQAMNWNLIQENVNNKARKPKVEKKERNFYNIEETTQMLECLKEEPIKYRALITLALDSGARRSEICALKWDDIDFEDCTLLIDNSLKVVNGKVDEKEAKTSSSKRKIYISKATIDVLKEYKCWQNEYIENQGKNWKGINRVFTSKNGAHMHPDTCGKIINKVLKKHNLSKLSFHELRHTSATILLESGINPKVVCDRMGHANPRVTMEIYAHVFDKTKKASANTFNTLIANS